MCGIDEYFCIIKSVTFKQDTGLPESNLQVSSLATYEYIPQKH